MYSARRSCPACTSSTQVLVPALTISKAADVSSTTPGSVVHYTVTVTNTGQTPYAAATFTDTLTDVLKTSKSVALPLSTLCCVMRRCSFNALFPASRAKGLIFPELEALSACMRQ